VKLTTDCIPCNINAAFKVMREIAVEESAMKDLLAEIMEIPALRGLDWSLTGSQLVEQVFKRITAIREITDPLRQQKDMQNEKCLELYPRLKSLVCESEDSLFTAVNLAIAGNAIDPMGYLTPQEIEQAIMASLEHPVPRNRFMDLRERLEESSLVMYMGDNCGEIVFDKLLIETIKARYELDVTYIVRSIPTLNDATLREAELIGIGDVATIMENGIDGPLAGTMLSRCSEQVQTLWSRADLIISKGGGNFDSLDEEENIIPPLYYMLMCKCVPYQDYFGVPLNHPVLFRACSSPVGDCIT
jgi:damage-control phosphatase, subfamily I